MPINPLRKRIALGQLEEAALRWTQVYGDEFPNLRDLCAQIADEIDKERGIA